MGITNDVFEVSLDSVYQGKKCVNVFHYLLWDTGVDAGDVLQAFLTELFPVFQDGLATEVFFTGIRCRNLFDDTETHQQDLATQGNNGIQGSERLPPWFVVNIRLIHDGQGIRDGRKAFSGWEEADILDGTTLQGNAPAMVGHLQNAVATPMVAVGGVGAYMLPIVVARVFEAATGYRLPVTYAEMMIRGFGVITQGLYRAFSTQNSRKELPAI